MKRKLFVLAVLVGVCVFNLADRPPAATASSHPITPGRGEVCLQSFSDAGADLSSGAALTFPLCGPSYCPTHLNNVCTCPPGTVRAGQPAPCDTWRPDCNAL